MIITVGSIIIDENKAPKHSLDSPKTYEEIKNEDNVALLVEEPYVVLDIDSENRNPNMWQEYIVH